MVQVKNSFDDVTLSKIGKGFVINLIGALAVFGTAYSQTGKIKESAIIAGSSFLSSIANAIREYSKGEESPN
jgi:hypothetical protein